MICAFRLCDNKNTVFCYFVSEFLLFNLLTGSLQKWDSSLKVIAEGYAAKCVWNHNPELEDTGENLFAGTGPLDLREALEKWFLGESVPRGAGSVKCIDLSFSAERQTGKNGKILCWRTWNLQTTNQIVFKRVGGETKPS